jgi:ferredoxin/flavodoxin
MSNTEIYYFTGSGNSLAVARDIAAPLNASVIPLVSTLGKERIHTDAEKLGIVFPVYDFKPPSIIKEFVAKLEDIRSKYLFAVCTYGISASGCLKHFETVVTSCGGRLSAGFAVAMPHNGIGSSRFTLAQHEKLLANWNARKDGVCSDIDAARRGYVETRSLFADMVLSGMIIKGAPVLLKLFAHVAINGWSSLAFAANDRCDGCGICAKLCPVRNITIANNKPVWASIKCAGCFACLHWCPKQAIGLGTARLDVRVYHHPGVTLWDMLGRNTDASAKVTGT